MNSREPVEKHCVTCGTLMRLRLYEAKRKYCSVNCYRHLSLADRLLSKTRISENGCHEYQGFLDEDGYGMITVKEGAGIHQSRRAHRVAWQITHGPIPDGLWVLHSCDNRRCVNVAHLFLGDAKANNEDMVSKVRNVTVVGSQCRNAKLTEAKVRAIKAIHASGEVTQRSLAVLFGVGYKAINKIVLNQRWKHVTK